MPKFHWYARAIFWLGFFELVRRGAAALRPAAELAQQLADYH
ncbi:MAG TPA: hypothetical protein VKQ30_26365 [Ktedonobacterales bacterium]|nr:hypothetical protein [Ktedonobacterales bacterium]